VWLFDILTPIVSIVCVGCKLHKPGLSNDRSGGLTFSAHHIALGQIREMDFVALFVLVVLLDHN
jgi:hypothetical protein